MTKACKPGRVIAYRGSFVSDDAKTTNEASLSIQYLCCECFVKTNIRYKIYVPYRKYMYPNGNIYTLLGIHVRYWKYMYPIGNICTTMEIYVPYWKIPAFGTLPVEP